MVQNFRVKQGPLALGPGEASRFTGSVWVHNDRTGKLVSNHHVTHVRGWTFSHQSCDLTVYTTDGLSICVTVTSETLDAMIEAREAVRAEGEQDV